MGRPELLLLNQYCVLFHCIYIHSDYVMDRAFGIPFADILCSPIHLEPVPRDTTFKSNVHTNIL